MFYELDITFSSRCWLWSCLQRALLRAFTSFCCSIFPGVAPPLLVELARLYMARFESRSLVSKRSTFFGNTRCLSNFRESASARVGHNSGWAIATYILQRSMDVHKMFGLGEFDVAMRGTLINNIFLTFAKRGPQRPGVDHDGNTRSGIGFVGPRWDIFKRSCRVIPQPLRPPKK